MFLAARQIGAYCTEHTYIPTTKLFRVFCEGGGRKGGGEVMRGNRRSWPPLHVTDIGTYYLTTRHPVPIG